MKVDEPVLLAIESSCDDTSAAVLVGRRLRSSLIATQGVHEQYGGVVPELASRAHLSNIVPVVSQALVEAGVKASQVDAVAFTRGPGLLGALLVGTSFAKGFALARGIPLIEVNHLQGHILSPMLQVGELYDTPSFPHLALVVSGGHTQIVRVDAPLRAEVLSTTIDDAVGEAFDKCAKEMGLPYPGGPHVDRLAQQGNANAFRLARPMYHDRNFSFSGLKTSFKYLLRDGLAADLHFIERHRADLCASLQATLIDMLLFKLTRLVAETGLREVTLGGGVAANSGLRQALAEWASEHACKVYIPERRFTTDNAAMIGIVGYYKYQAGLFADQSVSPSPNLPVG